MQRRQLLQELTNGILKIEPGHPTRVAVDGPDAAGKTVLADEVASILEQSGRSVIRASIDGFHNPSTVRHRRGTLSPEGYFHDSFNYNALIDSLLNPLGANGSRAYRSAVFDYRTDSNATTMPQVAAVNAILLFDGVFLLRPELLKYWDFKIFVEASFATTLARARQRDAALFGGAEQVTSRYEQRYIPGQRLYFAECRPKEVASVVIDNNDPANPEIL